MRAILPLLLVLNGCGGSSTVTTAHGAAYQVSCGGFFGNQLDCNVRAQQTCPAGFDPVSATPGTLVFTCSKRAVPQNVPAPI